MKAKKYILTFNLMVNVASFAFVSSINIQQKTEILERKSQLQALEIQLLQQELTDLREVTRNLQNSITHKDDTHAAIVDQPKDISDHAHTEHNWKYQVLKALKYEKMARFSMEERINSLVNLLEQKNQDMVNLLEQKNQDMVNLLEQNNQDNVKIFAEMKAGLSSVNGIQEKLKEELKNLTAGFMEPKCTQTLAGFNKSAKNCMIAFNAHLNKSIQHVEPWHTIVFDAVVTNHGNAYSGTTGIFTAPRSGVYVFYVHILGSSRPMEVILRKNDHELVYLYSQGTGRFGSDDNMAVVDLAEGDGVSVKKYADDGVAPFYVHKFFSNFAGFMLFPL